MSVLTHDEQRPGVRPSASPQRETSYAWGVSGGCGAAPRRRASNPPQWFRSEPRAHTNQSHDVKRRMRGGFRAGGEVRVSAASGGGVEPPTNNCGAQTPSQIDTNTLARREQDLFGANARGRIDAGCTNA